MTQSSGSSRRNGGFYQEQTPRHLPRITRLGRLLPGCERQLSHFLLSEPDIRLTAKRPVERRAKFCAPVDSVGVGNPQDLDVLKDLFSGDEKGGVYTIGRRAATDPKEVRRHQGEVWLKMAALLRAKGLTVEKPRHAAGYEVDADVRNAGKNLLIEIKSDTAAHDVYGGMGQLQLYRKLLPRLSDHMPVLLLPGLPHSAPVKAIEDCGVELCTFEATERDGEIDVVFSDTFLTVCGVEPDA